MSADARVLRPEQASLFDLVPDLLGTTSDARKSGGKPLFSSRKFTGKDAIEGRQAGQVYVKPQTLHQIRARTLNSARKRVFGLVLAFVALTLVAMVQMMWLGMQGSGPSNRPSVASLLPDRGEITDRNGSPLARAHPARSLFFYPDAMKDGGSPLVRSPSEIARELKAIIPRLNQAKVEQQLMAGKPAVLLSRILPEEANEVWALGEVAVQTPPEQERHYPQGRLAAHILGRSIPNDKGDFTGFGMEYQLNERLLDAEARANPVALSIDVRVQGALEDEMSRGMRLAQAKGAAGVVLDVDTGEVLAMSSLPDFDPNRISEEDAGNTLNRVTYRTEELGSVFKPITVAAAIDAGIITNLARQWNAKPVETPGRTYRDFEEKGGLLNIPQALAFSSNTVTMRVAKELGPQRLRHALMDLGMNLPPVIELGERGKPFWPKVEKNGEWSELTTMTVGFGHGFNVTPLHLANGYAAMVNGGIFRPATLLKVEPGQAKPGQRVFKASTSQKMRQLLRMVTKYGTGQSANAPGFRVGGKTGSAEKLIDGRYSKTRIVSTFAAAFPMDRPRYVVVVALDEPRITDAVAARTAAFNAAPIVGNLIRRTGPMLGVRPDNMRDVDVTDLDHLIKAY